MKENTQHCQHIMLCYFKGGKNATEMQNKIYGEGTVTDRTSKSSLQGFVLEIFHGTMLHGRVEQVKLIAIKLR